MFGGVRVLGSGKNLARILQAALTDAFLATPYLFVHDLAAPAVPMAYLPRTGTRAGALSGEMPGLGCACLLIFAFPFVKGPVRARGRAGGGVVDREARAGPPSRLDAAPAA